jgi:hypothetical protein
MSVKIGKRKGGGEESVVDVVYIYKVPMYPSGINTHISRGGREVRSR